MIDTHNHILPYCDDGADNWIEAEQMAKQAADQGIQVIVATPHHRKGIFANKPPHIHSLVTRLNERLLEASIPVIVHAGQEYHLSSMIKSDLVTGDIQGVARTRYVLVELSSRFPPKFVPAYLRLLKDKGLIPVIVHPERYKPVVDNPSLLAAWLKEGAYFQLTAGSILGQFGADVQRAAYTIAEYDLAHLLASDAHDCSLRGNRLQKGYSMLEQSFGGELTGRLQENARLLLQDQPLLMGVPKRFQRGKWYDFSFINR